MSYIANAQPRLLNRVSQDRFFLIFTNLRMAAASLQCILSQSSDSEAVELCRKVEEILEQLESQLKRRNPALTSPAAVPEASRLSGPRLVGQSHRITYCSSAMHRIVQMAERVANYETTVLITGETGVGKELIARLIHVSSPRHSAPLIPFNCAAVSKELFESQLFGHKQGSFTGANRDQMGIIRASASGTLVLDEIGELPLELQPKLLRFLQESEIHIVGETRPSKVNVRIIALTNRNLESEVAAGRFRADLYYRLNIVCLEVPPLRVRREDIPLLISFFLAKNADHRERIRFTSEAVERMTAYDWPGNVRELSNVVLRLTSLADENTVISVSDLPSEILHPQPDRTQAGGDLIRYAGANGHGNGNGNGNGNGHGVNGHGRNGNAQDMFATFDLPMSNDLTLAEAIDRLERERVKGALLQHNGNFAKAARNLGLSTFGLRKKYRRLSESAGEKSDQGQEPYSL